jgi:hypothetical protein
LAFVLVFFGLVLLLIVAAITMIAQPPERWVKWFTEKDKK